MILALAFLTSVNFFIYSSSQSTDNSGIATESQSSVPSPTEEKSSGSGFSILEEMIYENHFNSELSWFNKVFLHKVAQAQKTEMVHFDLWSPPPERFSF